MPVTALGPSWLDPNNLVDTFGLIGILVVVFAECGLLVGFFLPGDSLLFTAGLLVKQGTMSQPIWLVCLLITIAAIAGNQAGYMIGRKAGPAVFNRPESRFFKREHVDKSYAFFDKYGARAIILARFVPIVRTFTPITAGVSRMEYSTFVRFNVIGGTIWAFGVTLLGYFLGQVDVIEQNLELAILMVVAISCAPIALELLRARSRKRATDAMDVAHDLLDPDLDDMVEEARHPDGTL